MNHIFCFFCVICCSAHKTQIWASKGEKQELSFIQWNVWDTGLNLVIFIHCSITFIEYFKPFLSNICHLGLKREIIPSTSHFFPLSPPACIFRVISLFSHAASTPSMPHPMFASMCVSVCIMCCLKVSMCYWMIFRQYTRTHKLTNIGWGPSVQYSRAAAAARD